MLNGSQILDGFGWEDLPPVSTPVAVLTSGGLDSWTLLNLLHRREIAVRPLFVRSGLRWESSELAAIEAGLRSLRTHRWPRRLANGASAAAKPTAQDRGTSLELVTLELPLADLYADHWSIVDLPVPAEEAEDAEVDLPGRNALMMLKAAYWCQRHGVQHLVSGHLGTSPFPDATTEFISALRKLIAFSGPAIDVHLPFARMNKPEVMRCVPDLDYTPTFSCLAPREGRHCGRCNKCGERRRAFAESGRRDPLLAATACHANST